MNKLWGSGSGGNVLACILEPGNIERLKKHEPIEIDLNDADSPYKGGLPAKLKIVIAYSETPVADSREFAKLVKDPAMAVDRRTAVSEKKLPHCPECKSTIEQLGVGREKESILWTVFCPQCGCVLAIVPPIEELKRR